MPLIPIMPIASQPGVGKRANLPQGQEAPLCVPGGGGEGVLLQPLHLITATVPTDPLQPHTSSILLHLQRGRN